MLRKLLFVFFALFITGSALAQSSAIKGTVVDNESKEPIPFANVVVEQGGQQVSGGVTDFDGNFLIKPLKAGTYTVKASYVGYNPFVTAGVVCKVDKVTYLDVALESGTKQIEEVEVIVYQNLFDKDQVSSETTVTAEEIAKMPGRSVAAVATTMAGVFSRDGEIGSIRGSRSDGNVTYVDGVKVIGSSSLPEQAIAQVQVKVGGIEAKYGDVSGGIINITTKGPSNIYFGGFEGVTSEFLDPYGYNLGSVSISGPILRIKDKDYPDRKRSLLGFFLAMEYQNTEDSDPSYIGNWKIKDDYRNQIISTPIDRIAYGSTLVNVQSAALLGQEAFENLDTKSNIGRRDIRVQGKLDFQPSKKLNITLGGSYYNLDRRNYSFSYSLMNSDNNSHTNYTNWRTYLRLTQRLGSQSADSKSLISNAFYSIQFDFEKTDNLTEDYNHEDNFFDYGHVGKFEHHVEKNYTYQLDTTTGLNAYVHDNFYYVLDTFYAGTLNPEAAIYTTRYFEYPDILSELRGFKVDDDVQFGLGLMNGDAIPSVYSLWSAPGSVSNGYSISDNYQFRVSAYGSFNIKNHAIELGFEFEQRNYRSYSVAPRDLWTLGRSLANDHISQLDFTNPEYHYLTDANGNYILDDMGNKIFNDTISYSRLYSSESQALFDVRLRQALGKNLDGLEWLDIDSYDPSDLSIDYFSADELMNSGNSYVSYRGYDVYGNRLTKTPSLQDFFSDTYTDAIGNERYSRNVAPFEPTYAAAYIQDKFAFKDLIFNVGIRVDRFDANQMVLKDKYLLYEAYKVGDSDPKGIISNSNIPDNIGDDYVVYVDNISDPTAITGYRSGSTWYNAQGSEVSDPTTSVASASGISPYLVNPGIDMSSSEYEVSMSFEDYEPSIVVMPRISFSFPVSDEALFFAWYNVLSKRPTYNTLNPIDYLFFVTRSGGTNTFANPDLKPEKTIDYELGYQQKVSNSSSLRLVAYYKEMRDLQQAILVSGAYPTNYITYGNIDFGTVKGFSTTYDLRRTGNLSFRASYTLQFAEGTGSNATEFISLVRSGQPNLRTTIPLSFDQRHAFVGSIDFRFGSGKHYDGPESLEKILQDFGTNVVLRYGTGSPYTKRTIIGNNIEGSINGSRQPSTFTVNLTVDKSFVFKWGKEGSKKKTTHMNVYLDISNIFNTENVVSVYSTTGNPDDNGYLLADENQPEIETQVDPVAYANYYTMAINSPFNYALPRRIRLGVQISF